MKIAIHAKGNESIGIGNLSRMYELINYLKDDVIGIFECDEKLFLRYKQENIFRFDDLKSCIKFLKDQQISLYICDLVDANKNLSDEIKKIGIKKIIHFNSLEFGFEPDILFVCDGFDYECNFSHVKVYRGFEYYIIAQNIINARKKFKPKKQIKNVLFSFGGADPAFYTEHFVKTINDDKFNYQIVLGPAMDKNRKEKLQSTKKQNITFINSPKNLLSLLLKCDLFITLGGMSTYEAMYLGVPVCGVRWEYLAYIVKSFGEKNMINDLQNIQNAYENLLKLDINTINKNAKNAYEIISSHALKNIAKIIKENL